MLMPSPNFMYSLQNLGRSYTSYLRFHKMQKEKKKAGDRQFTKHKYTCHEPLKKLAEFPGFLFHIKYGKFAKNNHHPS